MNKLQINFYDETITVVCPTNYTALKDLIAGKYYLDPIDVDELIKYYINENDRVSIANEFDYKHLLSQVSLNKSNILKIFLEVSEQSKLYKREFESSKLELKLNDNEKEKLAQQEALRKEILEKERILKELMEKELEEKARKERERIEKERLEKERLEKERLEKERLEKERLEKERLEKERLEKERLEKERLEKERLEKERLEKEKLEKERIEKELFRESISKAVLESVNNSIEKIREELIQKTLLETSSVLEKSFCSKGSEIKKNETIHKGYACNECRVFPIVGYRYRCTECFNYDLCENCEEVKGDSHGHPLVKHRVQASGNPFNNNSNRGGCGFFNNFNKQCMPQWPFMKGQMSDKLKEMRENYDLSKFTNEQLISALKKANGNIDEAVNLMFQ